MKLITTKINNDFYEITDTRLFDKIKTDGEINKKILKNDWRGEKYSKLTDEEQDHLEIQLNK